MELQNAELEEEEETSAFYNVPLRGGNAIKMRRRCDAFLAENSFR